MVLYQVTLSVLCTQLRNWVHTSGVDVRQWEKSMVYNYDGHVVNLIFHLYRSVASYIYTEGQACTSTKGEKPIGITIT